MKYDTKSGNKPAGPFRDAALPYIDDAYTLAHFLMPDQADAEDAVQECYSRAQRQFDGFHGSAIKTWLFAILRNLCHAKLALESRQKASAEFADWGQAAEKPRRLTPVA